VGTTAGGLIVTVRPKKQPIQLWDDGGWLETEWLEDSVHEAKRPAGRQAMAWQESEEPYEL